MEDKELQFLEEQRDRYYDGDWSEMLNSLRYQSRNRKSSEEHKEKLRADIAKIEIHLGIRPKEGFLYLNGHCRVPANLQSSELESLVSILEKDTFVDKKEYRKLLLMCTREVLFMLKRNQRRKPPITYGDNLDNL